MHTKLYGSCHSQSECNTLQKNIGQASAGKGIRKHRGHGVDAAWSQWGRRGRGVDLHTARPGSQAHGSVRDPSGFTQGTGFKAHLSLLVFG